MKNINTLKFIVTPNHSMKVFVSKNNKLSELHEQGGKRADDNEKLIQIMIENNLPTVFPSLEFLTTEYQIDNLRPDSIAFDNDRNSFVIIEYKNVKHKGVVDQGMSYYKLLQEKKENFVLLYHNIKKKFLDVEKDVNWEETRVIFIAPEYTEHQKRASQSVSLPIELYEITKYDDGIILLNKIENKKEIKSKSKTTTTVRLGEYSEEDYLDGKYFRHTKPTEVSKKLFRELKNKIMNKFPEIEFRQNKKYAGFYSKKDGSAICTVEAARVKLKICYTIRKKNALPQSSFVRYMVDDKGKATSHWGLGDYMSEIKNESDIEKAIPLIEIVYSQKVK